MSAQDTAAGNPRVVIIGAGFGGLSATAALRRAPVSITLIDRENHHTFQPLLYQAATAALSTADIAWPIRAIVHQPNARVVMAEVRAIDVEARIVHTDGPDFAYDHLVVATGSTHSYFGHDDWAPFAPGLKRVADATALRTRILGAFERAEIEVATAERDRLLTFVIVGGGATGVEMAGAIAEVARDTLRRDFRTLDTRRTRIVLVEAGPRVLASMPDHLSDYASAALTRLGVELKLNTQVTGCDANGVDTSAGRIEASTLVWAAGVRASPAARWLGVTPDRHGRVPVGPDLSLPPHPEIHVIGDTAAVTTEGGLPVPGVAPAAKQMGRFVGHRIAALLSGRSAPDRFAYRDEGELATIGRNHAVARFGKLRLKGRVAWLLWSVAHIFFLITLRDRLVVSITWLWSYVTHARPARVFTRPEDTPAKP